MNTAGSKYDRLRMRSAWRTFEISRGAQPSDLERRLLDLQEKVADLNLDRDAVHLAAELAALQPDLDDDTRFALILLILINLAALAQGSTRFPVTGENSRKPMLEMLSALLSPDDSECSRRLDAIQSLLLDDLAPKVIGRSSTDRLPLLFLNPFIAHERSRKLEQRLIDSIVALEKRGRPFAESRVEAALADITKRPAIAGDTEIRFSDEQLRAIAIAAGSRLALISGGPGTGKTSIAVAILRVLARLGVAPNEVALSAPTGRAAFRMRDAVTSALAHIDDPAPEDDVLRAASIDAATVHRLLGYSPERGAFLHHRNNPIAARVVIVDEASMLDLALMERLVSALNPDARLIILGDADQLPSVSAGAAFRDLLPSSSSHPLFESSVRLTRNYRTRASDPSGSAIIAACNQINAGDTKMASTGEWRTKVDQIDFNGVEFLSANGTAIEGFLERWEQQHLIGDDIVTALINREYPATPASFSDEDRASLARLFAYRTNARILCVTRVGTSGSDAINARLHHHAIRNAPRIARSQPMIAGEPVIVVRNDYERGLFNGDQGIIVNTRDTDGHRYQTALFNRGGDFAAFRLDTMRDLIELGYATTVHKAQGSEFDIAAVILPDHDLPLLTRELLYTAVSRCRRGVAIIGNPDLLAAGITRKAERYSGVADELTSRFKSGSPKQLNLFGS